MNTNLAFLAAELENILTKINENKNMLIKDLEISSRFKLFLKLTGLEERPLTQEEVNMLAKQYSYYNANSKR